MRRIFALLAALALAVTLAACGGMEAQSDPTQSPSMPPVSSTPEEKEPTAEGETHVLVAYFSATGNTEGIAQHLQSILDADLYEIVPEEPCTSQDLNYNDDNCRANREQNDPDARPAIQGTLENPENYDVVFLGYPIWWGQAPKILYTFLERYDFGNATIIPFCTSGSSEIGSSAANLHDLAPNANWRSGQRFRGRATASDVETWVTSLGL